MRSLRRLSVALVTAALVFGIAACGGDSDTTDTNTSAPAGQTGGNTVNVQLGEDGVAGQQAGTPARRSGGPRGTGGTR